ncbi:MAG: NAD(P)-binding domain-containing protein [Burkholderiales bacterium]
MDIGLVGLRNDVVARRLARAGVRVFGSDAEGRAEALAAESILVALPDAVQVAQALRAPRVAWLDLPTGFATELAIQDIWPEFAPGDVIVDAGEGSAADAARRTAALASVRIEFVACRVRVDAAGESIALDLDGNPAALGILAPYVERVAGYHGA